LHVNVDNFPSGPSSTSTTTSITGTTTDQVLLASNPSRKAFYVMNNSKIASLYIYFGAPASTTVFSVKIGPRLEFVSDQPVYSGDIHGIWDVLDAAGKILVTELT